MLTFAITTSTKLASISLFEDDIMIGSININVIKTHSTTIVDQVKKLFEWTGKDINEVNTVILSKGPGSFTGVRIAMALIKGMYSMSNNVELYTVCELDALYYMAKDLAPIIVSGIDSRKGKISEAVDCYELAIFLDFDMYIAHIDFARKYEHMGRHKKALEEYKAAFRIDSRDEGLIEKIHYIENKYRNVIEEEDEKLNFGTVNLGIV